MFTQQVTVKEKKNGQERTVGGSTLVGVVGVMENKGTHIYYYRANSIFMGLTSWSGLGLSKTKKDAIECESLASSFLGDDAEQ